MTGPVPLEDIEDVVGWVKWQVQRWAAKGDHTRDEVDDMISAGVVILYETFEKWDAARSPKFSAYALSVFRNRLTDWYRREVTTSGRGHVPREAGTGKRGAIVYHGMVSLDAQRGEEASVAFSQDRALTHYDAVD